MVIAEEVRKKAEESHRAAEQITDLIGAIQDDTSHAVRVVENGAQLTTDGAIVVAKTHDAFTRIEASVQGMTTRIEQIAAAAQQVAASATKMQENINEVAAVAEQASASTSRTRGRVAAPMASIPTSASAWRRFEAAAEPRRLSRRQCRSGDQSAQVDAGARVHAKGCTRRRRS